MRSSSPRIAGACSLLAALLLSGSAAAQEAALLVPVRGQGASDAALQAATASLRRRLETQGYRVSVLEQGAAAVGTEAAPSDLGPLAAQAGASVVVDAVLGDFAGMTSLRVRVVSAQGTVLGEDSNLATEATLPQDAVLILANALQTVPPPSGGTPGGVESPFDLGPLPSTPAVAPAGPAGPEGQAPALRPRRQTRRRPDFPERRFWLGALLEPSLGTNRSSFNLLVGVRGEFQWRGLIVGLNFDYTFIKDYEPRSDPGYSTLAAFGLIGYQIRLGSDRLTLPLLIGGGYVPGNGGLLRIEAGLSIRPIDRLEIRAIIVCPNFWFLDEEMVLFTSFSLALLAGF